MSSSGLLGGAAALPVVARAQQGERVRRIAVLQGGGDRDNPRSQLNISAFLQALQQLGWTDGRNVSVDYRWPAGDADKARKYAAELVALAPDVILALASRRGTVAAGDTHGADCVSDRRRSGRGRLRR